MDESPHPRISGAITVSTFSSACDALVSEDLRRRAVLRQDGPNGMPRQRVLGEAMHEENGRSFAVVAKVDRDVVKLDALVFPVVKVR